MIQVNELRIGNLFQDEDNTFCYFAGAWQRNDGWIIRDSGNNTYKPAQVYAIPLSSAILQACGFENTHPENWYLSWESYELQYSTDDKELGILSPDGCTSGHTVYFPCGQLHLMQNIFFFFTGSELSINLDKVKA